MYLYVDKSRALADVPGELLDRLGDLSPVMVLWLSQERKLSRADAREVISSIRERGYYLQLPPVAADILQRGKPGG
jgi:uncharacterized protein YcgL (UPF0745 family)